jgi:hypothetical protein
VTDICDIVDDVPEFAINLAATVALTANSVAGPNNAPSRFCRIAPPWSSATQVKLSGSYDFPYAIRASVNYQHIPGLATTAQYVVPGADIAAGLGRTPSAGARATALVDLIEPNTLYRENSLNQVNLAFSRIFKMGIARLQPRIELHNAFNANTVTGMTTRYGGAWLNAANVLAPRLIKFGVQYDF